MNRRDEAFWAAVLTPPVAAEVYAVVTGKRPPLTHLLVRLPRVVFLAFWTWVLIHIVRRWQWH